MVKLHSFLYPIMFVPSQNFSCSFLFFIVPFSLFLEKPGIRGFALARSRNTVLKRLLHTSPVKLRLSLVCTTLKNCLEESNLLSPSLFL
jgi:hypothetical protein